MRCFAPALAAAAALLSAPVAHAADWVRAESPNFILYTDVSTASARTYLEKLEKFDTVLRARHGMKGDTPARRKLPVYLLDRDADLRRIWPDINRQVAGFYRSHLEDTVAVATADRRDDSVLLHEYVHHFMLANFPYNYPAWLTEGYAEYFMTFKLTSDGFEIGNVNRHRAQWLSSHPPISYETVLKARPMELRRPEAAIMYYAQAWALTHYMLSDKDRSRQLDAYIAAVGAGSDSVKAFTKVTGHSPEALTKLVERYLFKGFPYQRYSNAQFKPPPITVTPLPAAAGEVLLMTQRVMGDNGVDAPEDRADGPVLLAAARKLGAAYAGDRLADLMLARAEIKLGDLAVAERLLARLLAQNAQDTEVLVVYADHRLKAADSAPADRKAALRAEARAFAGRAYKLDTHRYQTLVAYARGRESVAGYPNENDLAVLLDALDLAPQVSVLRVKAAQALVARNRYGEAAQVLRPLALDPHGGAHVEAARELLTAIEARATAQPPSGKDGEPKDAEGRSGAASAPAS